MLRNTLRRRHLLVSSANRRSTMLSQDAEVLIWLCHKCNRGKTPGTLNRLIELQNSRWIVHLLAGCGKYKYQQTAGSGTKARTGSEPCLSYSIQSKLKIPQPQRVKHSSSWFRPLNQSFTLTRGFAPVIHKFTKSLKSMGNFRRFCVRLETKKLFDFNHLNRVQFETRRFQEGRYYGFQTGRGLAINPIMFMTQSY
jgi:hypothetical protein